MLNLRQTAVCALTTAWTALAAADGSMQMTNGLNEENWDQVTQRNIDGNLQPKIALHGVKNGFTINGSYLYWKAKVDNLDYANHTFLSIDPVGLTIAERAKVQELDFKWSSGGRLGIGYVFKNMESWKLNLTGTHLESHAHGETKVKSSELSMENLIATWSAVYMGEFLSRAESKWNLNFNTLNLDLGRDFFISKYISVSPFIGLQGVWIKQKDKLNYDGIWLTTIDLDFSRENSIDMHNHYRAGGFHFGTDFIFHIVKNFGLTGTMGGSIVYGSNKTAMDLDGGLLLEEGTPVLLSAAAHQVEKKARIRTSFESELGFIWEQFWNRDRNRFSLSATYAFAVWFNQNSFINISDAPNINNLTPDGLVSGYLSYSKP
jgi:Legionella pneumophila major outer membrane protein precursor